MSRDCGLQDTVAHRRDQQRARRPAARFLFDDDLQQRIRPVPVFRYPCEQLRNPPRRPLPELRDGDAVRTRAPGILLDALPRFPKLLDSEGQRTHRGLCLYKRNFAPNGATWTSSFPKRLCSP